MKVYCETITVTIEDNTRMEGSKNTLPSSAWSRLWTKVENLYAGGQEDWVSFRLSPYGKLPEEGDFVEAGTSCKTIRGEVVSSCRSGDGLKMVIVLRQPSFPYDGPPIQWEVMNRNSLRADSLGGQGRLVAMVDGAYQSILDGGDVSVSTPSGDTPVLSSLEDSLITWSEYETLRRKEIPNGGVVSEQEQEKRNIAYLFAGKLK